MTRTEDNNVIQAVAPERSDQARMGSARAIAVILVDLGSPSPEPGA